MGERKKIVGRLWAALLVFTGVAMFFSIPGKVAEIQEVKHYSDGAVLFIKFCFYLISILLTGGGLKKILGEKRTDNG